MSKYQKGKGKYAYGFTDEDIFESEEEKNKVFAMPEVEREIFISERIDKLCRLKERDEILKKKLDTGEKYKKKEQSKDILSESNSEDGQVSKSDDDWSEDSHVKRNRSISSSDYESSLSNSDEEKEKDAKKEVIFNLSIPDIEKIKITRQFCERNWDIPIFDECIKNAFVKINIYAGKSNSTSGNTGYIIGTIKDVQVLKDKPYVFIGKQCSKYINVLHAHKEKLFTFNVVSNSAINENEFNIWKSRMDAHKIALPTKTIIHDVSCNLGKIKSFKYSNEELSKMINKKMEEKIKNKDKNINITYQLDLLTEKYNAAKAKYEDTKDNQYLEIQNKVKPEIEVLLKMKEEREKKESMRAERDLVTQINKKNIERQRMDDLKYSLLNNKRQNKESDRYNPYKRKHCLPQNLYDTGYIKDKQNNEKKEKNDKEEQKKEDKKQESSQENKKEENEMESSLNYGARRFQRMKEIEEKIKSMGNVLEEMIKKDKEINEQKQKQQNNEETKNIDLKYFFSLASINKEQFLKNIEEQNKKLQSDPKVKIITLSDL